MYILVARTLPGDNVPILTTVKPQQNVPKKPHVHWSSFSHETCTDDDETVTPEYFTTYKPETSTHQSYDADSCRGSFDAVSCFRGEIFVFKGNVRQY